MHENTQLDDVDFLTVLNMFSRTNGDSLVQEKMDGTVLVGENDQE